ncbi:MAG: hypothetical protein JWP89_2742 [Schlesneria sp.]|nr:hypothetical protein [Schlesneria sp.]
MTGCTAHFALPHTRFDHGLDVIECTGSPRGSATIFSSTRCNTWPMAPMSRSDFDGAGRSARFFAMRGLLLPPDLHPISRAKEPSMLGNVRRVKQRTCGASVVKAGRVTESLTFPSLATVHNTTYCPNSPCKFRKGANVRASRRQQPLYCLPPFLTSSF